ncbi:MAG: extracellular solute-binding protein [Treponema sp.]|nr:extracellular solute-binding protein [Treponema sp.]
MKLVKRLMACVLMGLAAVLAFAGGSSQAGSAGKITITMLDSFVPGESLTPAVDAALKKFLAENPNVTIDREVIANADVPTKTQTLGPAGELPDIFTLKGQQTEVFVQNGWIIPLDEYLNANPAWKNSFKDGVFSNFTQNGNIYAIPYQVTNTCVYYNEKIFKEAGINEFPATWAELVEVCKTLKAKGITPIAFGNVGKWPAESAIMSTLGNRFTGNEWYQNIRERNGKAKWTDPEFVNSLRALKELVDIGTFNSDINSITDAQMRQMFMNGRAAMAIDGSWALGDFDANAPADLLPSIKLAALPSVSGGKGQQNAITGGAGWGYAVSAKIDPAKREIIGKFLESMTNSAFGAAQAATGSLTAVKPNNFTLPAKLVLTAKFDDFQKNRPFIPVYDHQLSSATMEAMQTGLQNLFIGQVTPEELAALIQAGYSR